MQTDGLQVSVVPDENSSIHNLGHTYHLNDTGTGNEAQGHETPFDHSNLIPNPFIFPSSILPVPDQELLPLPMSMSTPGNQWTPPCGEIEMLGGQQLPPFHYAAYTGMSPAPMMAQGNTTPSSTSSSPTSRFALSITPKFPGIPSPSRTGISRILLLYPPIHLPLLVSYTLKDVLIYLRLVHG